MVTRKMPSEVEGLTPALRNRITAEFNTLMAALDAAAAEPDPETLAELRTATDRLMRAVARIRLEAERLDQK